MFKYNFNDLDFAHKIDKPSEPSEDYARHLHPFLEILYFVKGDAEYTVEKQTKKLEEGDIILIQPGKYHFATVNSDVEYERYVFKLPIEALPYYLRDAVMSHGSFFTNTSKYALTFKQCDSYFGNFTDIELASLFMVETVKLLIMLCKLPTYSLNQDKGIVTQIMDYIDEHIRDNLTLETLAKHFNYSKSYIGNEFRKYMQIPLMQYIRSKKIIAAHNMLLSGKKAHEVAEAFGFTEYSTFYRTYLKIMGCPPTGNNDAI